MPFGTCFSKLGHYLFVGTKTGLQVYKMSALGGSPTLHASVTVPRAGGLAVSPDGRYLAVAHSKEGVGLYSVAAMVTGKPALLSRRTTNERLTDTSETMTVQVGFSLDGKYVVACDEEKDRITVMDVAALAANKIVSAYKGSVNVGVHPTALVFTKFKNGAQAVIVGCQNERAEANGDCKPRLNKGSLRLVNLDTMTQAKQIPVGCVLSRISKSGRTVLACLRGENSVAAVSMVTNKIVAKIPVGPLPVGIKHALNGKVAVVACSNRNSKDPGDIRIIDAVRNTPLLTLPAGRFPRDVAVSPDGTTVVVTEYGSGSFQVLNLRVLLAAAGKTV